jgi:4-carboxymuconolactone decarboxylase
MTEEEEISHEFCDELEPKPERERRHLRPHGLEVRGKGVIDAAGIVGYYTMLSMVMNTARTPLPAGARRG